MQSEAAFSNEMNETEITARKETLMRKLPLTF